jgi:uncharacterized RDD family membrane protein YckC
MAYGPPGATLDPTKVMGRRIAAWIIDFIPAVILVGIFSRHNAVTYSNVPSDFCSSFKLAHNGYFCFQSGGTAYTTAGLRGGTLLVWLVYYFVIAGVLQGATGATFGKHMVGLRVVDQNGNLCGMGKAMLRTLIGVFELGFCFLIALITASVTHPHRRVGDFAAGTFVVAKEAVGTPIMGGAPSGYPPPPWTPPTPTWGPPPGGAQTWGGPNPAYGTPPAASPPAATPPPSSAPPTWGTPAASPPPAETPSTWGTPAAGPQPAASPPAATEAPAATPSGDTPGWGAPSPSAAPEPTPTAAPQAQTPAAPSREPQWDAQRNAWVFWEAETNRWLQHDPVSGVWGPLR